MYEYLSVCLSIYLSNYLSLFSLSVAIKSPRPSCAGPEIEACTYGATSVVENP